jgi:hypothetical protein
MIEVSNNDLDDILNAFRALSLSGVVIGGTSNNVKADTFPSLLALVNERMKATERSFITLGCLR